MFVLKVLLNSSQSISQPKHCSPRLSMTDFVSLFSKYIPADFYHILGMLSHVGR